MRFAPHEVLDFMRTLKTVWDAQLFDGKNPLEVAQYFTLHDRDTGREVRHEAFADYVRALFQQLCMLRDSRGKTVADKLKDSGHTLDAVVNLCLPTAKGKLPIRNILTYNYDDLLETVFNEKMLAVDAARATQKKRSLRCKAVASQGFSDNSAPNELIIKHVHGYLPLFIGPINGQQYKIVLSEDSYDQLDDDWYNWTNLVQAQLLFSESCLCVGFSASDANFRRVIMRNRHKRGQADVSKEVPHYLILDPSVYLESAAASMITQTIDLSGWADEVEPGFPDDAARLRAFAASTRPGWEGHWRNSRKDKKQITLFELCALLRGDDPMDPKDAQALAKLSDRLAVHPKTDSIECEFASILLSKADKYYEDQYGLRVLWLAHPDIPKLLNDLRSGSI